ncbi:MAG TPA: sugar ABC transporter ATP-binding protein [Solirubrobacterales bacterium]|nr:sugar ABC transporter ATP-binding protein [Solirubrobacterales bacterium]
MPEENSVLQAQGVDKSFGATRALEGAGIEIAPGEIHALVGGNGSGKSTFLKCMGGIHQADAGTLRIEGREHDLRSFTPQAARAAGLHFVHQQLTTFAGMTLAENLAIGHGFEPGFPGRVRWRQMNRHAKQVLERFELPFAPTQDVASLSPATQTMLAIARALQDQEHADTGVLALDEPTATLPTQEVDLLLGTLRRYAAAGQAILFVSHRLDEVISFADRITVLRDGHVITTVATEGLAKSALAELIVGKEVSEIRNHARVPASAGDQLEVRGLCGGKVRNFDLTALTGEVIGIAGLVGSGRSTLLRMLGGVQAAEAGSVKVGGREVAVGSPRAAIKAGIAYLSEDRARDSVLSGLSVAENLAIVNVSAHRRLWQVSRRAERRGAREAMKRYQIKAHSPDSSIASLSGGNQQKVALARWLQLQVKVLLLDEPTQGVDVGARAELWRLILTAAANGTTAIVVSSDMEELVHLSERILVIEDGVVGAELAAEETTPGALSHVIQEAGVR